MPGDSSRLRYKVLLIDDSSLCRKMTKAVLERADIDVITLGTPLGFSPVLCLEKPDLALVDVSLPGFSGDQLVMFARQRLGALCPIVLYSEHPSAELALLAERCGAVGYIKKSADWEAMAADVIKFLSDHSAKQQGGIA